MQQQQFNTEFRYERTPADFSKRRDVVNKTILRLMRRFYLRKYSEATEYSNSKKSSLKSFGFAKREADPETVMHTAQRCADKLFLGEQKHIQDFSKHQDKNTGLAFYIGALLFPREMKKVKTSSAQRREVDRVYSCLYSYSHAKLEKLFENRSLGRLYELFYEESYAEGLLEKDETVSKNSEVYSEAMSELLARFLAC